MPKTLNRSSYFRTRPAPGPLCVQVGERVAYTRYFLRSIGVSATDPAWFRQGVVQEVDVDALSALVLWEGDQNPMRVLTCNLARKGANLRYCD